MSESLFDDFDDWFDFRMPKMPDVDRVLYGRNARNMRYKYKNRLFILCRF